MNTNYKLHNGDNLTFLQSYPDNTFDSIVTDPPYGIDFLGKEWDSHTGTVELYKECLRVLKPGGYLLAFSAARTYHRLAYSVELAGFEIRDQLMWLYSSGFPKAQDIGKAIDKRAGNANNLTRHDSDKKDNNGLDLGSGVRCPDCKKDSTARYTCTKGNDCGMVFKPTTAEGAQWNGFKTALKPAHEPIVMARKPFKGSTIDNVLKNGLGAMNIDATRVPWADAADSNITVGGYADTFANTNAGRYPSNVIGEVEEGYQKYFYNPKVSRKERHSGFDDASDTQDSMIAAMGGHRTGDGNSTYWTPDSGNVYVHGLKERYKRWCESRLITQTTNGNNHPTVKPVALMEYLIKLVTPPSTPTLQRKVLDPFNGSGSTGMAAVALGHHYTGIDLDKHYIEISAKRIDAWTAPEVNANPLPDDLFGE